MRITLPQKSGFSYSGPSDLRLPSPPQFLTIQGPGLRAKLLPCLGGSQRGAAGSGGRTTQEQGLGSGRAAEAPGPLQGLAAGPPGVGGPHHLAPAGFPQSCMPEMPLCSPSGGFTLSYFRPLENKAFSESCHLGQIGSQFHPPRDCGLSPALSTHETSRSSTENLLGGVDSLPHKRPWCAWASILQVVSGYQGPLGGQSCTPGPTL